MPLQLLGATVKSPDCCRDFSMRITPYGWTDNQITRNPRDRAAPASWPVPIVSRPASSDNRRRSASASPRRLAVNPVRPGREQR